MCSVASSASHCPRIFFFFFAVNSECYIYIKLKAILSLFPGLLRAALILFFLEITVVVKIEKFLVLSFWSGKRNYLAGF